MFFKFTAQVAVAAANAEEKEMAAAMAKMEAQEMAEMAATPDAKVAFAAGVVAAKVEFVDSSEKVEFVNLSDPELLYALLEPGEGQTEPPVRLLKGPWMLEYAKKLRACKSEEERRALKLKRRQELFAAEPEAFYSAAEVRKLEKNERSRPCACSRDPGSTSAPRSSARASRTRSAAR